MVDIPTGYFVLVTGGTFLLGVLSIFLLTRFFGTTRQSGTVESSYGEKRKPTVEATVFFLQELTENLSKLYKRTNQDMNRLNDENKQRRLTFLNYVSGAMSSLIDVYRDLEKNGKFDWQHFDATDRYLENAMKYVPNRQERNDLISLRSQILTTADKYWSKDSELLTEHQRKEMQTWIKKRYKV